MTTASLRLPPLPVLQSGNLPIDSTDGKSQELTVSVANIFLAASTS